MAHSGTLENPAPNARIVYISIHIVFRSVSPPSDPFAMFPEYTREELAAGLDAVAMDLLAAAGVDGPPVDAFDLARRLGITVAVDDCQRGRARYVRLDARRPARSRPTILLRSDPRGERRHWAVAHEIGEYAAYRVFAQWGVDVREIVPQAREEVANRLAGRLLLPTAWFLADAAIAGWDLLAPEGPIRHGQPRVDRAADAGMSATGHHDDFRSRRGLLSPQQCARPGAAPFGRGAGLLAHGPRRRLPAANRRRPADDSRLAGP